MLRVLADRPGQSLRKASMTGRPGTTGLRTHEELLQQRTLWSLRAAVQIRTGRRAYGGVQFVYEYRSRRLRRAPDTCRSHDRRIPPRAIAAASESSRRERRRARSEIAARCSPPGGGRRVNNETWFT